MPLTNDEHLTNIYLRDRQIQVVMTLTIEGKTKEDLSTYKILRVINMMSWKVGQFITSDLVEHLIERCGVMVVIV